MNNQPYKIYFYKNSNGEQPVLEYLKKLKSQNTKSSRLNLNKIQDYIQVLATMGKAAGLPYIKHIEDDIWELRPLKNRIFFVSFTKGRFVLLHHFLKSTQRTPKNEIEKAKKEYQEIIDNGGFEDEE